MNDKERVIDRLNDISKIFEDKNLFELSVTCQFAIEIIKEQEKEIAEDKTYISGLESIIKEQKKEIERLKEKLELLYVQALYAIGDLGHAMKTTSPEHTLEISQELEDKHDSIIKKTVEGEF